MVACGCSGCGRWPQFVRIVSLAAGIPFAISIESEFGMVLSSSPDSTSVGHLIHASAGREYETHRLDGCEPALQRPGDRDDPRERQQHGGEMGGRA